jgi:hypothetical protein
MLLQRYNNSPNNGRNGGANAYITNNNFSPMAHYTATLEQQQQQFPHPSMYSQKKRKMDTLLEDPTGTFSSTAAVNNGGKKKKTKKKKKVVDPNAPPKPKRKTGLNKPLILSDALSELMDGDKEVNILFLFKCIKREIIVYLYIYFFKTAFKARTCS